RVRYLVLRLGETEDDAARAREKADEAYRRLVPRLFGTGEDFVAVAQQYSEDPVRAQQPVWVGEGPDVLAEVTQHGLHEYIEGIPVGKIGKPFEWGRAVYLFEVLEREKPAPIPLEEAEALIREELLARKHQELRLRLNEGLMEKAGVQVYESTLQALAAEAAASLAARP
ncbi:MAG: peptidyl-prolyl cis-trans isomerase, partial [Thermodesulfobacteriota bacterium]